MASMFRRNELKREQGLWDAKGVGAQFQYEAALLHVWIQNGERCMSGRLPSCVNTNISEL